MHEIIVNVCESKKFVQLARENVVPPRSAQMTPGDCETSRNTLRTSNRGVVVHIEVRTFSTSSFAVYCLRRTRMSYISP